MALDTCSARTPLGEMAGCLLFNVDDQSFVLVMTRDDRLYAARFSEKDYQQKSGWTELSPEARVGLWQYCNGVDAVHVHMPGGIGLLIRRDADSGLPLLRTRYRTKERIESGWSHFEWALQALLTAAGLPEGQLMMADHYSSALVTREPGGRCRVLKVGSYSDAVVRHRPVSGLFAVMHNARLLYLKDPSESAAFDAVLPEAVAGRIMAWHNEQSGRNP